MQLQSILHTPLSNDAYAIQEDTLVIRLRAAKGDLQNCSLFYGDRVCIKEPIEVTKVKMEKIGSDTLFDYFEGIIQSSYTRVCYYFMLFDDKNNIKYYSEDGFSDDMKDHRTQYFQFPYIHREDIVQIPDWTKQMVMYHIFPDSFASGNARISKKSDSILYENGWKSESKNGGTLKGILENLDYIQNLELNCLYLNPIFKAASYHKYDTIDYYKIDPCVGTMEDLKELVKECHKRNIRVILDGVFNHCGSGFFAFIDVLEKGEQSKYKDWFYELKFPIRYETPPNYEAFAYVKEMPKLNTGNADVVEYFCNVGKFWIQQADIDGWRLDVANEVNHDFWRSFRKSVKDVKKDVFLIGEIWEDAKVWLMGDQFDSTMNYTFSYICREFFAEELIGLKEFDEKINHMNLRYQKATALAQMNFLDTHDVPRFLSYCGGDIEKFKLAVFYMMTAVGIPSIFYGDEKMISGIKEIEYRKPMPWEQNDTQNLESYFHKWIYVRRNSSALCEGNYRTLLTDEKNYIYLFSRESKDELVIVVLNMGKNEQIVKISNVKNQKWLELGEGQRGMGNQILCPEKSGKIFKLLEVVGNEN